MGEPHAILHVGAPKCGSSALQAALTRSAGLCGPDGRPMVYVGCRLWSRGATALDGRALRLSGAHSPYGYVSWPNHVNMDPARAEPIWNALRLTIKTGMRRGHVPILSNEAWIAGPAAFGERLAAWGAGPVDVVAYVRPPLEWLNAAYWQWGIWTGLPFSRWYARSQMAYRFGALLEQWAALPGVRLSVSDAKRDTVRLFAESYGLHLPPARTVGNSGASAALVGFLFRNRRFRPTAHEAATEFVVQRWCPPVPGPRPWALTAHDVQTVRGDTFRDVRRLLALFDPAEAERIAADTLWTGESAYHPRIVAGTPGLRDTAGLCGLFGALAEGVRAVSLVLGVQPDLAAEPPPDADMETWDAALCQLMATLLERDQQVRQRVGHGGLGLAWRLLDRFRA